MQGRTISHYKVLEKLGEGGMGEVYRAHDTKLNRDVALKILPQVFAQDSQRMARFEREAQVLASLNHPHIAQIYGLEEADGTKALVLELVEGETLAEQISQGPIPVDDALKIALQICEGLEAAHEKGVIHRDLKPANIMVTPSGHSKVMDFGVAKRVTRREGDLTSLTREGTILGTLAYMSPEQLKGGEVDTRSDVFSLGVVLYEIFTGFHPFLGGTQEETVNAILSQDPSPLICYIEHVPERLQSTLDKMLAKDPKRRYQSIHEVRTRLQHLLGVNQAVLGPRIAAIGITLLVLAIAAILVWQFILLPSIVVQPVEINSLAVLPLDDLMHDPEQEYFVEGMHEALITELSKIGALKVIARPSTVRYKGSDKTISEIAKELDVDALVGGSVLRSENQVRITAQVIQATTEQNLWVDSYDRELRDILSLHSEVAKAIAEQIHVALTPEEKERLSSRQAVQPEAYEAYLKGLHHLGRRLPNDFRVALRHFQKAREIDPNHALAYVGIADAYSFLSAFGEIPPSEGKKRTMEALTKALDIDNTLGEAHASLALEKLYNYDFIAAEEDFKKAIELNPNYAMAHNWYSVLLSLLGRNGEAIERSTRAKELDPLSSRIASSLAVSYYRARQYDRALEEMLKAVELDPGFWATHELMGNIYVAKGMYEDAIKAYETGLSLSGGRASDAGYAYAVAGESHKAREFIERFEKLSDARSIALVYVGLAENDLAFEWLEKAYHLQDRYLYQIASFPIWDPLRDDPRYEDFLRVRLRLPEDAIATHVAER